MIEKTVLLISPSLSIDKYTIQPWMSPHLGLMRLACYLRGNGHHVEVLDLDIEYYVQSVTLEEKLKERQWDVVGFSVLDETLINDISNMYTVKEISPQSLLVAGGMEAQFNYQEILDKSPCEIVILGEGEIPMLKLINGDPFDTIDGIVMKRNAVPMCEKEFCDSTKLINWEEIDYEKYWNIYLRKHEGHITESVKDKIFTVRVFSKNKCPFSCKYCTSTNQLPVASGRDSVPLVGLNADDLIDTVIRICRVQPKVRTIYFTDDDFCFDKKRVIEFCRKVIALNLKVKFMCLSRITDLNEEVISWLVKAGFRMLNVGVESFSDKVLQEINKKCTARLISENLSLMKKHGLHAYMGIILSTPETTLDDLEITVSEALRYLRDPHFSISIAMATIPLKGSTYYEMTSNYLTKIERIPGTNKWCKRNIMIYADDPVVRQIQQEFHETIQDVIREKIHEGALINNSSADVAKIKLQHMELLIKRAKAQSV